MTRGILGSIGVLVALVGALFCTMFIGRAAAGGDEHGTVPVYTGLVVFFGGVMVAGGYLAWRMLAGSLGPIDPPTAGAARPGTVGDGGRAPRPPRSAADRERAILRLAERERGRLTIMEVAARCDLTVADAKAELDRLVLAQVAEIRVSDSGVLVYVFPGFLSDDDKARAADF